MLILFTEKIRKFNIRNGICNINTVCLTFFHTIKSTIYQIFISSYISKIMIYFFKSSWSIN